MIGLLLMVRLLETKRKGSVLFKLKQVLNVCFLKKKYLYLHLIFI